MFILLCLIPLSYMVYFFFRIKKKYNKSISFDITHGLRCYCCKSDLMKFEDLMFNAAKNDGKFSPEIKICTSCNREEKLNYLDGKIINKNKFKRLLLSNKGNKIQYLLLIIMFIFLILDIVFTISGSTRLFFYHSQLFQFLYWIWFVEKFKLTTISEAQKNPLD